MFSVIIPLYNKADYIEKAVDSVLRQTFRHFELIVVNDGSTDGSAQKLANFNDTRLRIVTQSNAGVSTSRNNGVREARSDYVVFLDADDWWDVSFLEEMRSLVTRFPEAGMYGSGHFIVKNGINKPSQVGVEAGFVAGYIDYFEVYARNFWVPVNCSFVVVRKSVFEEENGFRPALKFGEDLDLWIRIALKHKTGYLNKHLAYSNQDVMQAGRALGTGKQWEKTEHVIFNLDYLHAHEAHNPSLKMLLDGLRVRSLQEFYLHSQYPQETKAILAQVDFRKQPALFRCIYYAPKKITVAYFQIKRLGSLFKQMLLRKLHTMHINRQDLS